MTPWGSGYITDVGYISSFHSAQSPSLMAAAALLNGFHATQPKRDEKIHFLDIGCGMGITALVTAAANPSWHVTGLDFNPSHIAAARAIATEAQIGNITFIECDLTNFPESHEAQNLEPIDAITAHGVWTWVNEPVQNGIIRLLNAKLKPGGMFHVSYNLITGWQNALGLQRLVREAGLRLAQRSDKQAAAGLKIAGDLLSAGAPTSFSEGFGKTILDRMKDLPNSYIAHEFMNQHWRPVMHSDIANRLADAKLEFAGSCRLLTNFPQLTLSESQRAILEQFDDPAMMELFKDICRPQALRSDVFIRGARRIDAVTRDATLNEMFLGLTASEASWKFEFDVADGKAQMSEPYYRQIFSRLMEGPASVRELLSLPGLQGRRDNPAELIGVAVGTDQTVLVPNPNVALDDRCERLNGVLLRAQFAAGQGGGPIVFALPALGGGITLPNFEGLIVHECAARPDAIEPREMAARLAIHQGPDERAALTANLKLFFATDANLMRNLGLKL